jgi:hypothetical protein
MLPSMLYGLMKNIAYNQAQFIIRPSLERNQHKTERKGGYHGDQASQLNFRRTRMFESLWRREVEKLGLSLWLLCDTIGLMPR